MTVLNGRPGPLSEPIGVRRRTLLKAISGGMLLGAAPALGFARGEPRRVEIAVVGAGPFGAATAMQLALAGARSVLLIGPAESEASASPAHALASHYDESRNVTAMDSDAEWAVLARDSIDPIRRLEKRSGTKILHALGSLRVTQRHLADGYFDLDGIRANAERLGVDLTTLDVDALAARYPEARFDPHSIGLLQTRDAGLLRPRRLVDALRRVATDEGVQWQGAEVTRIEPGPDRVDLSLGTGDRVRAARVLVATGAAPIGHALLAERPEERPVVHAHRPTHIEVPDDFETRLPPTMLTQASGNEFFGGFVSPPLRYPDGRRYLKVVGETRSLADGKPVSNQAEGSVRAARRLLPSLDPIGVHDRNCMTTDTPSGRPIIDWVDKRLAVAIAGNGKGAKAALEIGRRAAELVLARQQV